MAPADQSNRLLAAFACDAASSERRRKRARPTSSQHTAASLCCGRMTPAPSLPPRSPELMSSSDSGLLVIDVQEKLIRLIPGYERIVWNLGRLIDGAKLFNLHPYLPQTNTPRASAARRPNWRRGWIGRRPRHLSVASAARKSPRRSSGSRSTTGSWRELKPTSAFSKRCSISWRAGSACMSPSMQPARVLKSINASLSIG